MQIEIDLNGYYEIDLVKYRKKSLNIFVQALFVFLSLHSVYNYLRSLIRAALPRNLRK